MGLFDEFLPEGMKPPTMVVPVIGTMGGGFNDDRDGGSRKHKAGDIYAEPGTPVVAPADMEYLYGGKGGSHLRDNDYWAHFRDVNSGKEYRFAHHNDPSNLTPGDVVPQGEQWSTVGSAVDKPHIHMGVVHPETGHEDWVGSLGLERGQNLAQLEQKAGKVAAKTPGLFDEFIEQPKQQGMFDEFINPPIQETSSPSTVDNTITKTLDNAGKISIQTPKEQMLADILKTPDQVKTALQNIIDWPHENISVPLANLLVSKTGLPETQQTPLDTLMRPGETGQVGGEPVEGDIQAPLGDLAKTVVAGGLDVPVYGSAGKVIESGKNLVSSFLPKEAIFAPAQTAKAVELGNIPELSQQLTDTNQLINHIKTGNWDAANELAAIRGQSEKGASFARAAGIESKAAPLAEESAQRVSTLKGYLEAREKSLDRLVISRDDTKQLLDVLKNREIDVVQPGTEIGIDPKTIQYFYGGGPDSTKMVDFLAENSAKLGVSGAISQAAKQFGLSEKSIRDAIGALSKVSAGEVGSFNAQQIYKTAAAVDSTSFPLSDVLSGVEYKEKLPSIRDVGITVPNIPQMPYAIDVAENTTPKGNLRPGKAEFLSHSVISRNLFEGDGPILDWFKPWHQTLFEQPYYRRFLNNNYQETNLLNGVKDSAAAIKENIEPISKRLDEVIAGYKTSQSDLDYYKKLLSKQATGSVQAQETAAKITELEKVKYPSEAIALEKEAELKFQELERLHPDIRIQRALDGNKTSLSLLNAEEKQVYTNLGEMYKQYKGRLDAQGVPTLSGPYTHHIFHWAGFDTDQGLKAFANKLWWQQETTPTLLTFLSREGALNWFPSAYHSADAYIGAASRKLAFNPWYAKWSPAMDRWDQTGMGDTSKWLREFLQKNMTSESAGWVDSLTNGLVNFEYSHYLLGNLSPAVLHLFKVLQTPGYWGVGATVKGTTQYAEGMLSKMGSGKSENLRAMEFYNLAPGLIQDLEQSPAWAGTFQPSFWQKLRGGTFESSTTNVASALLNPTRITEHFDRGVQVLSSIARGETVGATANSINNATMDALLRMNFYGWDSPQFMQKHRVLTMFQQQPFKLTEMKGQLIRDALMGERDQYGGGYWPKIARMAVLLGGAWEAGQLAGLDLGKHTFLHLPFTADTMSGGHGLAIAPAISDISMLKGDLDEVWTNGIKNWLSYGGAVQKLAQDRIPERYNENRLQWLVGVPSTGWREQAGEKSEAIRSRQRKQALRSAVLHSGDVNPYQFLQQMLEEKQ